jgi:hypothetical protein
MCNLSAGWHGVVVSRVHDETGKVRPALTATQQLKYGDKTHVLQSSTESHRCELYRTGGDDALEFAGLVHHALAVQKADDVTAGVDSALEQLRSSMAAISEFKQANKYASPVFHGCSDFWHSSPCYRLLSDCETLD